MNPSRCITKTFEVTFPDIFRTFYFLIEGGADVSWSDRIWEKNAGDLPETVHLIDVREINHVGGNIKTGD